MANRLARGVKRAYDPQRTRQRILSAASTEFQARGYHATSMHDIMVLAAVPGGSIYHYFRTKKSLGLAVIRESVAQLIEETWITPIRAATSTKAGVLAAVQAVALQIEQDRRGVRGCPLNNLAIELSLVDPDFRAACRELFERWTTAIAGRIRQDIRERKLRTMDPRETATAVVAAFSGAMAIAKARQRAEPIHVCGRLFAALLPAAVRR